MTDHFHQCAQCGQTVITRQDPPICQTCRKLDRAPQGEAVRLFQPAPTQLPGQLTISARCTCPDDCNCHHPHRMNYCGCKQHG